MTRDRAGGYVPKQYCSFWGGRSLLGDALARAERVVPTTRLLTVVAEEHLSFWTRELADRPRGNVIVQPSNRGTATGVLLPTLAVMERDPDARVVLLASDHFVEHEEVLESSLRAGLRLTDEGEDGIILIGATPDAPVPDYGWIVPGGAGGRLRSVRAFIEKPGVVRAAELRAQGALWNTFLVIARASALIDLYAQRLPELLARFLSMKPHRSARAARAVYQGLESKDFSRDLAQGSEESLRLLVAPPCGWTDLGTPERVEECFLRARRAGHGRPRASAIHGS